MRNKSDVTDTDFVLQTERGDKFLNFNQKLTYLCNQMSNSDEVLIKMSFSRGNTSINFFLGGAKMGKKIFREAKMISIMPKLSNLV